MEAVKWKLGLGILWINFNFRHCGYQIENYKKIAVMGASNFELNFEELCRYKLNFIPADNRDDAPRSSLLLDLRCRHVNALADWSQSDAVVKNPSIPSIAKVLTMAQEVLVKKLGILEEGQPLNQENLQNYQKMFETPLSKDTIIQAEKILDDYTPKKIIKAKKNVATKKNGSNPAI